MPAHMVQSSMRLFAAKVLPVIREFGGPEPHAVSYDEVLRHRGAGAGPRADQLAAAGGDPLVSPEPRS
jgi:hypothetical protein